MSIISWRTTILAALLLSASDVAQADAVSVATTPDHNTLLPKRGMTMDRVQKRFGEPNTRLAAVGKPPITRWLYSRFVVYFENRQVIHAVAKDSPGN